MRTLILIIGLSALYQSCTKEPVFDAEKTAELADHYLNFNIAKVDYFLPDQDIMTVSTRQETGFITFQDVNTLDRYLIMGGVLSIQSDSVTLLGSMDFSNSAESSFEAEHFELEFYLTESKSNLIALTDSTYRYESNNSLFVKLRDEDWGPQEMFGDQYINQLLLTLPNPIDTTHVWGMESISSNGFYYEGENLDLASVYYDAETDVIELGGSFDVFLKILSCGYYDFYQVSDAEFLVEIK